MRHTRTPVYTGCVDVNTRLDLRAITRDRVKRPHPSVTDRPPLLNPFATEGYFCPVTIRRAEENVHEYKCVCNERVALVARPRESRQA